MAVKNCVEDALLFFLILLTASDLFALLCFAGGGSSTAGC